MFEDHGNAVCLRPSLGFLPSMEHNHIELVVALMPARADRGSLVFIFQFSIFQFPFLLSIDFSEILSPFYLQYSNLDSKERIFEDE